MYRYDKGSEMLTLAFDEFVGVCPYDYSEVGGCVQLDP